MLVAVLCAILGAMGFVAGRVTARRGAERRMDAAEQALAASETRLRLAMRVTGLGLWDYRAGEEHVGSNEEVARLLGYDPAGFHETRAAFVERLHPDDRAAVRSCFREYLQGVRADYACEFRMRTADGGYRWFRSVGQAVERDPDGTARRVVGTYLDIDDQVRAMRSLSELSARLIAVQEAERGRLARELHDEVGQQLTALRLNLHALSRAEEVSAAPALLRRLEDCRGILADTLAGIRDRALDLRPPMLDDMGLVPTLDWYCRRQEERAGVCIMLSAPADLERFAEQIELTAFRMVQEAVNNALRHGGAQTLEVVVKVEAAWLIVEVVDDGGGFDPRAVRYDGFGLGAMRERVTLAGGRLEVESFAGAGTRIRAGLPVRPPVRDESTDGQAAVGGGAAGE